MDKEKITLYISKESEFFYMSILYMINEMPNIMIERFGYDGNEIRMNRANHKSILILRYAWLDEHDIIDFNRFIANLQGVAVAIYLEPSELYLASSLYRIGVQGFFTQRVTKAEFAQCLSAMVEGRTFFSQDIIPKILPGINSFRDEIESPFLSQRESEVLKLIIAGYTTKEIASKLYLSARTVEGHRARLLHKFEVRNTAELVVAAIRKQEVA